MQANQIQQDAIAELIEAARAHMNAASRVQSEKAGTYERKVAEDRLFGSAYFRLRAALAAAEVSA